MYNENDYLEVHKNYLMHHGVKGQKWGIRRYQNPDGSLTPEGEKELEKEYKNAEFAANYMAKIVQEKRNNSKTIKLYPKNDPKFKQEIEDAKKFTKLFGNKTVKEMTANVHSMDDGYDYVRVLMDSKVMKGYQIESMAQVSKTTPNNPINGVIGSYDKNGNFYTKQYKGGK